MSYLDMLQVVFVLILIRGAVVGDNILLSRVALICCLTALFLTKLGLNVEMLPYILFFIWLHSASLKIAYRE